MADPQPTYPQAPASRLASVRETRAALERHGLYTKHRLGQNFLVDDTVIRRILGLAELGPDDRVLEVGPGIGTLTVALLPRAAHVVAVEADRTLEPVLAETCAQDSDKFELVWGDALRAVPHRLPDGGAGITKFVSNLPYQIAATIILQAFEQMPGLQRAVVMVQAEVADRIAARPGTKDYGAYTAKLALYGQVTGRFEVGRGCFMPAPHVESAVVRIDRDERRIGLSLREQNDAEADFPMPEEYKGDQTLKAGQNIVGLASAFDEAFGGEEWTPDAPAEEEKKDGLPCRDPGTR